MKEEKKGKEGKKFHLHIHNIHIKKVNDCCILLYAYHTRIYYIQIYVVCPPIWISAGMNSDGKRIFVG